MAGHDDNKPKNNETEIKEVNESNENNAENIREGEICFNLIITPC